MFKFMVKSLKWLGIACAIGVLIRVGEVLIIKHNESNFILSNKHNDYNVLIIFMIIQYIIVQKAAESDNTPKDKRRKNAF